MQQVLFAARLFQKIAFTHLRSDVRRLEPLDKFLHLDQTVRISKKMKLTVESVRNEQGERVYRVK